MSLGRPNRQLTLANEDEYYANKARIDEAQAAIDSFQAMNEAGKKAYDKKMELLRVIEAGKEAERQLLQLSGVKSSDQTAISGPSESSSSTSYGSVWQPAHAGGHQKHHANMGPNNIPHPNYNPQWQAFPSSFVHHPPPGNQQTLPTTYQNSVFVQSHEQFVSHQAPTNKRVTSNTARQHMPTAQQRQPLAMQPVTQQLLHSNSHQTRPQMPAGPSATSYNGNQRTTLAPTHDAAVPSFAPMKNEYSHFPGSSSAPDSTNKDSVSKPTLSGSAVRAVTPDTRSTTPSTALSDTVGRLEEQIKALNASSSHPVPSNEALSGTSLSPHYQHLANNLAQAEWLEALVENWQSTAPPKSLMSLPNSTIRVCKTADSMVYLVHTDPKTKKTDMIPFSLFKDMKKSASSRTINQNLHGSTHHSNPPSGQVAHIAQNSTAQIRSHTPDMELSTPTARSRTLLASDDSPTRSPKSVDKKRLAKDILRALRPTPSKQSLYSRSPDQSVGQESFSEKPVHPIPPIIGNQPTAIQNEADPPLSVPEVSSKPSGTSSLSNIPAPSDPHTISSGPYYRPRVFMDTASSNSYQPQTAESSISTASHPVPQIENTLDADKANETPLPSVAPQIPVSNAPKPQTPLFLPSSPVSPVLSTVDELEGSPSREPSCYVLVPPLPDYVKKYKAQQLNRKRRRISTPMEDELSIIEIGSSDRSEGEDVNSVHVNLACSGFVNDESERQAVMLSCSRMLERPCKWDGCEVILGSAEKLIQHLAHQHGQYSASKRIAVCMWQQCGQHGRNMKELFQHVKKHAMLPLLCAYQDCQESFRTPRQLARHHRRIHINGELKPPASLFRPTTLVPPGPVPENVPFYLVAPVGQAVMSKERHAKLELLVRRKIAGPVCEGIRPYNAASQVPRTSSEEERRVSNQPYDFLTHPSVNLTTRPSQPARLRDIEDLNSGEISDLAYNETLVLWPGSDELEPTDDDIEEMATPTIGAKSLEVEGELADEIAPSERSHDEQAVEIMLSIP